MAVLTKSIVLVLASVAIVSNGECIIDGTAHNYNDYSCAIMKFVDGIVGLPASFGNSSDICDGSWADSSCHAPLGLWLSLSMPGLKGCPDWNVALPDELFSFVLKENNLNCTDVDLSNLPSYLGWFQISSTNMTGTVTWPSNSEISTFKINDNKFEGSVDLSAINAVGIEIQNNRFTSANWDYIVENVTLLLANNNLFSDTLNPDTFPNPLFSNLKDNNFESPIDFRSMADDVTLILDTTVQCDADVYCNSGEISADRNNLVCTGADGCGQTCVCVETCSVCRKRCKDAYHNCWKDDKDLVEACGGVYEICDNECLTNECIKDKI